MSRNSRRILSKLKRTCTGILIKVLPDTHFLSVSGYCHCCDEKVVFSSLNEWLRDYFVCSNCKSLPRERALMFIINKYYPDWKNLKIHESSPGNRGASTKLKAQCGDYISSQYFPNEKIGKKIEGFINIDLESQSFDNEVFDIVVTQDVMEHVYAPDLAFKEIARTLKPGGSHIFTVPLVNKFHKTERWAEKGLNGEPVFLNEPEYHGNPIDPKGSPVTMHWGYDIVNYIKESSQLTSTIEHIDDLTLGIRAEYIEVIVSKKDI